MTRNLHLYMQAKQLKDFKKSGKCIKWEQKNNYSFPAHCEKSWENDFYVKDVVSTWM